jgi:excisionase family DNA binding protein
MKPHRALGQLDAAPSLPPLRGPSTKPPTPSADSLATTLTALGSIPSAFAELQREVRALTHAVRKVDARLPPQLVSIREAASVLGCSTATVRRKLGNGELASVRLGHTVRVDLSKLVALDGKDIAALLADVRRRATSSS